MTDDSVKNLKEKIADATVDSGLSADETTISIPAAEILDLIQQLESSHKKIEWLERKKRTIADLALAAHNWSKAKLELADKRILHIEEILETGQGVFDGLADDTEFKRGYRSALHWFRSEILDDDLFAEEKRTAADAKD